MPKMLVVLLAAAFVVAVSFAAACRRYCRNHCHSWNCQYGC